MTRRSLHRVPNHVDISWDDELAAVWLKWADEYDEGTIVKDAVMFAIDYVRTHDVKHWVGDLSVSKRGLSPADQAWVGGPFKREIAETPLTKLVLVPPGPETGQDVSWLADWEANTRAEFGDRFDARLLATEDQIRAFFLG